MRPPTRDLTPVDLGSYSSRVTLMAGNAAIQAAERLRARIFEAVAKKLEVTPGASSWPPTASSSRGRRGPRSLTFAEAVVLAEACTGVLGPGSYAPPKRAGQYKGGGVGPLALLLLLGLRRRGGRGRETGGMLRRQGLDRPRRRAGPQPAPGGGPVEGSVYMGLGEVLMESRSSARASTRTPPCSTTRAQRRWTRRGSERSSWRRTTRGGLRRQGCGQGPLLPVIPAVANAVFDAVGVRVDEAPITPDKVRPGLGRAQRGQAARRTQSSRCSRSGGPRSRRRLVGSRPGIAVRRRCAHDRLPAFRYVAARTVTEAATDPGRARSRGHGRGGGTDLYPNMKRRQFTPKVVVGLRGVEGCDRHHGQRRPRASARAPRCRRSPPSRAIAARLPGARPAAALVSSPLLRNVGTIGGNVCVDTRCTYYNQSEAWRTAVGFCMKKDGDICLVAPSPHLLGRLLVGHGAGDGGPGLPR